MRSYYKIALFAFFIFTFVSCRHNSVGLDFTNAKGELTTLSNLTFRFDKPLVNDSLLNRWDSAGYVKFEPAIRGRFRWNTTNELVFSPEGPLPPATRFTATLNRSLLQYSNYDRLDVDGPLHFYTPDLALENAHVSWIAQGSQPSTAYPQADLYFNFPVNPAALQEKMQFLSGQQPLSYSLVTVSADSRISVRFNNIKAQDKDIDMQLQLAKGLIPQGGSHGTEQVINAQLQIPSPFNIAINEVAARHDGTTGTVYVHTSQQVIADDIRQYIRIVPEVKFTVELADDGFIISSDAFDAEKSYQLSLLKGIRGNIGGILREQHDENIAFGELAPSISFANSKAVYLAAQGNKNIEVKLVNVPKIKLVVSKIYENNLLAADRYGYYPSGQEDEYSYGSASDRYLQLGDVVYEKEIETRNLPRYGNSRLLQFSPKDELPDFKGIYHISIRSTDDYWVSDSRFISMSDLGLIAREAKDKIMVFVNSIQKATAVEGVQVLAYAANNQLLGLGTSNADGVADIAWTRKTFSGFKPAMIIAKTANDFNYLPFNNTRVNTSRFEVGGRQLHPSGLDAFIYAERDIYRPGEKIHFSVILRDQKWKSPGALPVKMKFLMPNGKEWKAFRKTLNDQGAAEAEVELLASAITGTYTLEVYAANDVLLGSSNFNVEEFVPDRIRLQTKLDKITLTPGDKTTLTIHADNFFGPPAANRNYEYEWQVKPKDFSSRQYANYDFSLNNTAVSFDKNVGEGKTDADGNARVQFDIPQKYRGNGLLQADVYSTVFDETGRPVSRKSQADIYTQDIFAGIARSDYHYHPLRQPVRFGLIALDKAGNPAAGDVEVSIIKHEYRTLLKKSGRYFRYESQPDDKIIGKQRMHLSGTSGSYNFSPQSPGNYEIRVSLPGSACYVSQSFYSYGSWGADNNSFEVNNEGNIDIQPDKDAYRAEESARVQFKTPFDGRMLVTLETDKLLWYRYVDVVNRMASVDINLGEACLPNAYITATLFKPHAESELPLTVAHGFQNLKVEEPRRHMKVTILAGTQVRSKTTQKVTVKAAPNSEVTLAAVDNGVLQVTDYVSPDPYKYFYSRRALSVYPYDLYPLLFPEIRARISSSGGDGDLEMSKRTNPMPARRVQIVSYWSGIRKTNASGEAVFELNIPAFSGEIRLMAVSYKDDQFGSADMAIKVADPIVLSTALPRFMSPGDSVLVPVTISNTTDKTASAKLDIVAASPLSIQGPALQSTEIKPHSEQQVLFRVAAINSIGIGTVRVRARAMGETFTNNTELSVRPASPLQVLTGSGSLQAGQSVLVDMARGDFLPATSSYSLTVSRYPAMELGKQLSYLLQYPYGCTEQTISAAFPQLYYGDMLQQMTSTLKAQSATANENVLEALRKIRLRQLYNGAVTLWDGEGTENWWATIYAAHFLLEAQKAGFEVDKDMLNSMLNYINRRLQVKELIPYYYNGNQKKKIAPKEVAYSLFVLAMANLPNISAMNYYKANAQLLSLDAKYLLSAAYALSGDRQRFKALLPDSFSGEASEPQSGGSFYSAIRDEGVALNALAEVDPGNAQVPFMTKHVIQQLKGRSWYSTQECAFAFVALGKLARQANQSAATATVQLNGKLLGRLTGNNFVVRPADLGAGKPEITSSGKGMLYYYWQSEGVSASGSYKEEDSYIKVRRRFFDRFGRPVSNNQFKQNDLVIVQVSLEKKYSGDIENIAISDILPAGFEVENTRTGDIPGMDWIKDQSVPVAMDLRDDRVNLFVNMHKNTQYYYYALRAVSPGVFRMGPISAEAMYNGEYHSYNGAGSIRIEK